jgi:hypothetical protein
VSNVVNMVNMFRVSNFNGDISKWDIHNGSCIANMFLNSRFSGQLLTG